MSELILFDEDGWDSTASQLALNQLVAGNPARAADVNKLFEILADAFSRPDVYGFALPANSVDTEHIKDGAVDQNAIDLSTFTPTADDDPATKAYVDSLLTGVTADAISLAEPTDAYDGGAPGSLVPDIILYGSGALTYTTKLYKAVCDGFLTVMTQGSDRTSNYRLTIVASQTQGDVSSLPIYTDQPEEGEDREDLKVDLAVLTDMVDKVRYDQTQRGGTMTAVVPLRKNDYFRVVAFKHKYGNSHASLTVMTNKMTFTAFASTATPPELVTA